MIVTLLVFFLVLSILVVIHEFGHFFVAKKSGMLVQEFGLGLPPRVWGIKIGDTLYSINLLPFGGFVKIYGEDPTEVSNKSKDKSLKGRAFYQKPWWQRALVIVAGPFMNFMLAVVVISYLFTKGVYVPAHKVTVVSVEKNSPAAEANLRKNDIVVSIEKPGEKAFPVTTVQELISTAKKNAGMLITLHYKRDGKNMSVSLTPRKDPPAGQGMLGLVITDVMKKSYSWVEAPFAGLKESLSISAQFYQQLVGMVGKLVTLQKQQVDVSGPVGIAQLTGQAVKDGFDSVLQLLGLLSLNLALINIIPFPALDGGQFAFVMYELVTRRKINDQIKAKINAVGFMFLLFLIAAISLNDIRKLFMQ
ncbi:MAG: M50 family metallopeptidase [Patescibacteria group bacterium]|jgi:regulator of sigma E protease